MDPMVTCPKCQSKSRLEEVLTAQSNQNVIFTCSKCNFVKRNIETSKG